MSYIEKYFQDMGFAIQQIELLEHEAFVDNYRITNRDSGWVTFFKWKESINDEGFWKSINGRLKLLLLNEVGFDKSIIYNNKSLLQFIDINSPMLTPDERINKILEYIRKLTTYDGEAIVIYYADPKVLTALNFINKEECLFYFRTAVKKGLLDNDPVNSWADSLSLTSDGLSRIIKIMESESSRYCFVAMSFDSALDNVYNDAIEIAIIKTGFLPIRVDKVYVDSDKTINDEIIAGIKKARFTIADFTHHKAGVYFEAGYALGRGQRVIYTCREDEIGKAHFDIRNYQHIVWKDADDLKRKLIDKINAFIRD